jgi:hypothetical protein
VPQAPGPRYCQHAWSQYLMVHQTRSIVNSILLRAARDMSHAICQGCLRAISIASWLAGLPGAKRCSAARGMQQRMHLLQQLQPASLAHLRYVPVAQAGYCHSMCLWCRQATAIPTVECQPLFIKGYPARGNVGSWDARPHCCFGCFGGVSLAILCLWAA